MHLFLYTFLTISTVDLSMRCRYLLTSFIGHEGPMPGINGYRYWSYCGHSFLKLGLRTFGNGHMTRYCSTYIGFHKLAWLLLQQIRAADLVKD